MATLTFISISKET